MFLNRTAADPLRQAVTDRARTFHRKREPRRFRTEGCAGRSVPSVSVSTYPRVVPPTAPRRLPALLLAAAGGVVTDFAFPDFSIWPLAFVGVAMLVLAIRRDSARWAMAMGTVWGLGFFLPHLWWAHYAVGPVPWVALALSQSLMT